MPDVWELRGPAFMGVYAVLVLVSLVAAAFMRWQLSGPSSTPGPDPVLDPYETAYITGGPFAVVNAAVASLVARQALSLSSTGRVLTVSGMLPDDAYPAERVVYDKVIMTETATVPEIRAAAEPAGRDVGRSLESLGLVLSPSEQWSARWLPLAMGLLPLALGVPKIVIGIWRDRPVVFLFIACIITVALAGHFFGRRIFASRAGKALVERMRARHSALRTTGTGSSTMSAPPARPPTASCRRPMWRWRRPSSASPPWPAGPTRRWRRRSPRLPTRAARAAAPRRAEAPPAGAEAAAAVVAAAINPNIAPPRRTGNHQRRHPARAMPTSTCHGNSATTLAASVDCPSPLSGRPRCGRWSQRLPPRIPCILYSDIGIDV